LRLPGFAEDHFLGDELGGKSAKRDAVQHSVVQRSVVTQ
jgi:hypothetical protein